MLYDFEGLSLFLSLALLLYIGDTYDARTRIRVSDTDSNPSVGSSISQNQGLEDSFLKDTNFIFGHRDTVGKKIFRGKKYFIFRLELLVIC